MTCAFFLGLDLGQSPDPTAICALEKLETTGPVPTPPLYRMHMLRRYPLNTPYPEIVDEVARLVKKPKLQGCVLVPDQTGVGVPPVQSLRKMELPCRLKPVVITSGFNATLAEDGSFHVPKKDLVSCLLLLLHSNRLQSNKAIPEWETLKKEMQNFKMKITTAGNEVYEAWRSGINDDLVLACAIAAWVAERGTPAYIAPQFIDTPKLQTPGERLPRFFGTAGRLGKRDNRRGER